MLDRHIGSAQSSGQSEDIVAVSAILIVGIVWSSEIVLRPKLVEIFDVPSG